MPGMFIRRAGALSLRLADARDEEDMFLPLIFIPAMPLLFASFLLTTINLDLDFDLTLDLLPIFMLGMFGMSCCARTVALAAKSSAAMKSVKSFAFNLNLFITSPQQCSGFKEQPAIDGFAHFNQLMIMVVRRHASAYSSTKNCKRA